MSIALAAARHLAEASGWTLAYLPLQKHLYIAELVHAGRHGTTFLDGRFLATDFGPLHETVRRRLGWYGMRRVRDTFGRVSELPPAAVSVLDEVFAAFRDRSPGALVAITQRNGGAWARRYSPGIEIPIATSDLLADGAALFSEAR